MRPLSRARLVCAAWLLVATASSASAQFHIDTWTTEHGLPQSSVNAILQSRDGFIWLATFGGLVRFDGVTFQSFTTVNAPGMRTSRLLSLVETPDGALWARTDGLGVLRYLDGAFDTFGVADGLPLDIVSDLRVSRGALIAETTAGTVRWDGTRFVPHATPATAGHDGAVIARADSGAVWVSDSGGLTRLEDGRVTRAVSGLSARRGREDRDGRLWLETPDRRLVVVTASGVRVFTEADGVPPFATLSVTQDRDGVMWFGLRGDAGLLRYDGARFTRITTADGLPNDNVGPVFQDREGTHWVPTDGGLSRVTPRPMTTFTTADGLDADNVYPIFEDRRGDIWIGAWRGLTRYRDGRFESMSEAAGLVSENIMSFAEDADGALWIGTWGGGVRRLAPGGVTSFGGPDAPPGPIVRALLSTSRGLWAGGASGLFLHRAGVWHAFDAAAGYTGGEVHVLAEGRDGTLWIGTGSGLWRLRDGTFTHFDERAGFPGGTVRAIHEEADGTLWLGTYDSGLIRFRNNGFARLTTREGLWANGAFRLIADDRGQFWITSNVGIYRVSRADLNAAADGRVAEITAVPYGRRDGMLQTECNGGGQPAGIRARDGRIWFPTQKGVVVFHPDDVPVLPEPPAVVFTGLRVAEEPVPLADRVAIDGGVRSLEVHYAALTFVRPELTRYRYRLEGLDDRWVEAGAQRTIRFPQLPYGTYDLRIIAANRDGVWSTDGARLRIVVPPPFWRTPWFVALAVAAAGALAWTGHRRRIGNLRRQEAQREAFARQLLASQEEDRRRIAAELHDGLSQNLVVIRNWALVGQRGVAAGDPLHTRLGEIEATAKLALDEVRGVVHDLAPHNLERLGLARTVDEMIQRMADASGVEFACRLAEVDGRVPPPAQINLYRVLQEAVTNVVKHAQATHGWVELDVEPATLRAVVRDNGRGFEPGATAGGFGLLGMSERVRMIGGRLSVSSAPGVGTTVTIELPLDKGAA